jgi:hypothetical protein
VIALRINDAAGDRRARHSLDCRNCQFKKPRFRRALAVFGRSAWAKSCAISMHGFVKVRCTWMNWYAIEGSLDDNTFEQLD